MIYIKCILHGKPGTAMERYSKKEKTRQKHPLSRMPRRTLSLWEVLSRLFVLKIFPWRICKAKGKVIITAALGEKDLEFDEFRVSIT